MDRTYVNIGHYMNAGPASLPRPASWGQRVGATSPGTLDPYYYGNDNTVFIGLEANASKVFAIQVETDIRCSAEPNKGLIVEVVMDGVARHCVWASFAESSVKQYSIPGRFSQDMHYPNMVNLHMYRFVDPDHGECMSFSRLLLC
jgi:hypothetical protein